MIGISFADLPIELHVRILCILHFPDVISFSRTCRTFHTIIRGNPSIQYSVELQKAGMINIPEHSSTSLSSRLLMLKEREKSWATLDFKFSHIIDAPFKGFSTEFTFPTGFCHIPEEAPHTSNNYVNLYSIEMPSKEEETMVSEDWKLTRGPRAAMILGYKSIPWEKGLVAFVIRNAPMDGGFCDITIKFSCLFGSASDNFIPIKNPVHLCSIDMLRDHHVDIAVSGKYLAVVVMPSNEVFVLDWRTGEMIANTIRIANGGIVFLQDDILINTKIFMGFSLDFYQISLFEMDSTQDEEIIKVPQIFHILSLDLPKLRTGVGIHQATCTSSPTPPSVVYDRQYVRPDRPFVNDPTEDIMAFEYTFVPRRALYVPERTHILIIHRYALMEIIKITTSEIPSSSTHPPAVRMSWKTWGPYFTRWLVVGIPTTDAYGQYFCRLELASIEEMNGLGIRLGKTLTMWDFNPSHVRYMAANKDALLHVNQPDDTNMSDHNGHSQSYDKNTSITVVGAEWASLRGHLDRRLPVNTAQVFKTLKERECNRIPAEDIFNEDVVGILPYVRLDKAIASENKHAMVKIDEERVIAVSSVVVPGNLFNPKSIEAFYLG